MPELPEVETIRTQLKRVIFNKKIKEVIVKDKRIVKNMPAQKFKARVEGRIIKGVLRRGKVLILKLEEELFIIVHLRISGWLILSKAEEKFSRVIFRLSDGQLLNFCDQRVLGEIKLVEDWHQLPIVKTMGPEPLELRKDRFIKLAEGKRTKIKPLLMDQRFLAGIGNVYAQESLFCAGIHPERSAQSLTKPELGAIYRCLVSIVKQAIQEKGSSVDTYRQINGEEGKYVPSLKVYQRQGNPCFKCKTLINRKIIGGRGTCFCPCCQK